MRFSRTLPFLVVAAALVAACSDGGGDATASTPAATVELSTVPAATTTDPPATTTTEPATTTTEVPPVVYPLTGLPVTDGNELAVLRTAVVAKVGNYDAHPQWGTNKADIVYEEIINAGVSRFAMVFQSQTSERVGPIRSGRLQDVDLFGSFNSPIFAWSGGNGTVTNAVNNSDLVNLSESRCAGSCFRTRDDSPSEFTLFFDINRVWDAAAGAGGVPGAQFQYRAATDVVQGLPSIGVQVVMESYDIEWTWNTINLVYDRQQNGRADNDKSGEQVTTNNVVILEMVYNKGISGSPDAQSVGSGVAWVFTGGNMVHGTWTRADRSAPFTLTADDGSPILLTPGRTFIELPRAGDNVTPK